MDTEPDYYEILEVHPKASPEVIARAYRTLAARYHPDARPREEKAQAEERMKLLNQAYQVLSNPARRAEYDQRYRRRLASDSPTTPPPPRPPETIPRTPPAAPSHYAYCAYHPSTPRAAFCHECGKPICAACIGFSRRQPVCAQCAPSSLRQELRGRVAKVTALARDVSWPLAVAACLACWAGALGGGALLFPILLVVSPNSPRAILVMALFLGFLISTAIALSLVGAFERRGRTWPGTCLLVLASLAATGIGMHWWLADHAYPGCKALSVGENWKAFCELSVAGATRGALRDPSLRRCYALAALRLADEECRKQSKRQLPLSRIAVRYAEDIMSFVPLEASRPRPSGESPSGAPFPAVPVSAAEIKMQLVEAFSRALSRRDALTRRKEWDRAMQLLGVPRPEMQSVAQASPPQTKEHLPPGRETSASVSPVSEPSKSLDTAQKYAEAVCWCEMADALRARLACLARGEIKLWDTVKELASAAGEGEPLGELFELPDQLVRKVGGPEPGLYEVHAKQMISELLKDIPPERWLRCSRNVQRMVDEVRNAQGAPG